MKTPTRSLGYTRSQLTAAAVVGGAWIAFYILMVASGGHAARSAVEFAEASGGKVAHSAVVFQERSELTRGADASSKP